MTIVTAHPPKRRPAEKRVQPAHLEQAVITASKPEKRAQPAGEIAPEGRDYSERGGRQ